MEGEGWGRQLAGFARERGGYDRPEPRRTPIIRAKAALSYRRKGGFAAKALRERRHPENDMITAHNSMMALCRD
jgi:hypothetical protein